MLLKQHIIIKYKIKYNFTEYSLYKKGLKIKKSNINGMGLFARKYFPKNKKIIEFKGDHLTTEQMNKRYGYDVTKKTPPYANRHTSRLNFIPPNKRYWIDPIINRFGGEYVNDGIYGQAKPYANVKIHARFITATKLIRPDEELVMNYGNIYWEKIKN